MNTITTDDLDTHYRAHVLADSLSPHGERLTTIKLQYPRFIHSEMMTHRMLSRNAASSRAIPTIKLIEQVEQDPYIPAIFNYVVKGMGVGGPMNEEDAAEARRLWIAAAMNAARMARKLLALGLDKSRVNRLLEPFLWYSAIFTGTEWANFLGLRDHPGAQPEIQAVARCIRRAFEASQPVDLKEGQWHLPLVTEEELAVLCKMRQTHGDDIASRELRLLKMLSASRCARVSYDRDDDEPRVKTLERAETLMGNGHYSPFEHVARPLTELEWCEIGLRQDYERSMAVPVGREPEGLDAMEFRANLRGWASMRLEIPNESRFDLAMAEG